MRKSDIMLKQLLAAAAEEERAVRALVRAESPIHFPDLASKKIGPVKNPSLHPEMRAVTSSRK